MTLLEFWGCVMIAFGPALAMFSLTVAHDPIRVILLIASSFFWLLSFLSVAICWSVISTFCNYLIIGAYLAVISQEIFRYLFHKTTKQAQIYLAKLLETSMNKQQSTAPRSSEIHLDRNAATEFRDRIPLSYVSGLGFGLMNGAFSLMNILTDYIGPGTVGLKGDSQYFLIVTSLTALAFILLNVSWSILLSESIERTDRRLAMFVLGTHLIATTITFVNRFHLQLISILAIYIITIVCGLAAFQVAGLRPKWQPVTLRGQTSGAPATRVG